MSGQLPIDRRRANEHAPRVLEEQQQTANELAAQQRANDPSAERLDRAREATEAAKRRGQQERQAGENEEVEDRG